MKLIYSEEVSDALDKDKPLVALESTVIAQGLPYPENLETAVEIENIVRENGAIPATIAVFNGEFYVGLNDAQIELLAASENIRKISRRDLSVAVAKKLNCATTVSTTSLIAHLAKIKVFATGGIGGVHRGYANDVSADLPELAQTPITVVCSGAKIVLDLPATREWLETHGVTVLGFGCEEMPGFYSTKSGLFVDETVNSASEVAEIIKARDELKLKNAILVTVPVPSEFEIKLSELEQFLKTSLQKAVFSNITGKEITPFLLSEMSKQSGGKTLKANIELLKNNAEIAAKIAVEITKPK